MNKIVVICGPTSTGKTSLALKLCSPFNGEIISADSRQVFKFMDIGTGKAPLDKPNLKIEKGEGFWRVDGIPIYMYDVASPCHPYTVFDYCQKAKNELVGILNRGKTPFIVGGTGFYIDILLGKKEVSNVPPNEKVRNDLLSKSLAELQELALKQSHRSFNHSDFNNKLRLIRAIEISLSKQERGEVVIPAKAGIHNSGTTDTLFLGLTAPRNYLYQRADIWTQKIVEKGLILETKGLLDRGFEGCAPLKGLVYKDTVDFLGEKISLDKMIERMKFDLHGYIRRQLTWFNQNAEIKWFNVQDKNFDIEAQEYVQSFLDGK